MQFNFAIIVYFHISIYTIYLVVQDQPYQLPRRLSHIITYILWIQTNIHRIDFISHREEGVNVKVIVHPPKTPEGLRDLHKRVAAVHAEAVLKYIAKLPCPKEQKMELVASIQNSFKE